MISGGRKALAMAVGVAALAAVAGGVALLVLQDKITVKDVSGAIVSDVTVFLSGNHWGGCFCLFRKGGDQKVGNVTAGPSQVAALSSTHALFFDPAAVWNGVPGDPYPITVGPPVSMKIKMWTYFGGSSAAGDLSFAAGQFTKYKTGINLVSAGVTSPTGTLPTRLSCDDIPSLKSGPSAHFDGTAVNVYYAEGASCSGYACEGLGGSSCADRQFIFVYSTASSNVMLHELGHSLLGPDHWPSSTVGLDNIMNDSASTRTSISTGQAIFMNYDSKSVFNTLRNNPGIDCNAKCPRIDLDESWSDYCMPPPATPPPPPPPIEAWYACIECRDGEFERVITNPDEKTVTALSRPFLPAGADDPQVRETDEAHRANVLAGRQRRAAIALSELAKHGSIEARRALETAYAGRGAYREDVMRQLLRSYQSMQQP